MPEEIKNETTNAVLKEMIIGLTKITDDRLGNLKEGVSEIKQLMLGFATKVEMEELRKDVDRKIEEFSKNYNASIKRIEDGFVKHNEDDKESFGGLTKGQRETRDTLKTWIGGLAVIVILLPFLIQLAFHYWLHF